jgi:hypothetical protein
MSISAGLRRRVIEAAQNRCGYCLMPAEYVYAPMEIDHIWPVTLGGTDDENNLWLACPRCNLYKGSQTQGYDPETDGNVLLFNPRNQIWAEHFHWNDTKTQIISLTSTGRVTVATLQFNLEEAVAFRSFIVAAGWIPPFS